MHIYSRMRAIMLVALLSCFIAMAYGDLVCGSKYCKEHPCTGPTVAKSSCPSPSVYRANHAGKCACCPACVTFLGNNFFRNEKENELTKYKISCLAARHCYILSYNRIA